MAYVRGVRTFAVLKRLTRRQWPTLEISIRRSAWLFISQTRDSRLIKPATALLGLAAVVILFSSPANNPTTTQSPDKVRAELTAQDIYLGSAVGVELTRMRCCL